MLKFDETVCLPRGQMESLMAIAHALDWARDTVTKVSAGDKGTFYAISEYHWDRVVEALDTVPTYPVKVVAPPDEKSA